MGFLHGVETIELTTGPVPVLEVKSAIIGLIGTAPQGEPGVLHIVRTLAEATARFGLTEGTLGNACRAIFDHVNVTVVAINAYDPAEHPGGVGDVNAADVIALIPSFSDAFAQFGFFPKILIAPGWSYQAGVGAALVSAAAKCRGVALIDVPGGQTPEQAVAFKGTFGQGNAIVCYPRVRIFDLQAEAEALDWLSGRAAGLMAQVDKEEGYHVSPSNHVLQGVIGVERLLSYVPSDEDSELNYVNSQGLTSILYWNGSGYRLFGNRTAAFPASSAPLTFIPWRRVASIIEESIEYYSVQWLDKPMFTRPEDARFGLLDRVQESVNDFIRAKMAEGVLVSGKCYIRLDDNPTSELAAGHLTYTYEITPPPPAERITHRAVIDSAALGTVFAQLVGG